MAKSKQQKLKEKLDKVFSLYIRQRYADDNGYASCVTCGAIKHWKEQQAGHYVPRNILSTRFDEQNVNVQCVGCNVFNKGKMDEYALFMLNEYGDDVLKDLNQRKHKLTKLYVGDYEHLISVYERKIEDLHE